MTQRPGWYDLCIRAVVRGEAALMREAIALGMPLNETCIYDSYTPLQYASHEGGKPAIVAALIEAGADLDVRAKGSKSSIDQTALMFAAKAGALEVVKLLLDAGADLHAQDQHGATALGHAAQGGTDTHVHIARELLRAGAKADAQCLLYAAWSGSVGMVRLLLKTGVGVNEPSRLGLPLQWAVGKGRTEIVEELLRAGADPNRHPPTTFGQYKGKSPLEVARERKDAKLVALLEDAAAGRLPVRAERPFFTAADVPAIWARLEAATKLIADEEPLLRGGASEADLAALEAAIGATLPDDFRASYLRHDGQAGNEAYFPDEFLHLGIGYDLLTVKLILADWRVWKELTDVGQFAGNHATPDDGVRAEWWHPGWVAIATDGGGDSLCVDLAPAEGGVVGQVIWMRHERGDRRRLASSLAELLAMLADHYEARYV